MTGIDINMPGLWQGFTAVIRRDLLLAWKRPGDIFESVVLFRNGLHFVSPGSRAEFGTVVF